MGNHGFKSVSPSAVSTSFKESMLSTSILPGSPVNRGWPATTFPFATDDLIRNKLAVGRLRDLADVEDLRAAIAATSKPTELET